MDDAMNDNPNAQNVTWHDMPNGYTVQVIHKPGFRTVQIMDNESRAVCELPHSTPVELFEPICKALESRWDAGWLEGHRNAFRPTT